MSILRAFFLLLLSLGLALPAPAQDGLGARQPLPGHSGGAGPLAVRVMPGYPNAPNLSQAERRPVRPGDEYELVLWGNVGNGAPLPPGESYTYRWEIEHGPDVEFVDDGSLEGPVTNPAFIQEAVRVNLLHGSLGETFTARLTVSDTSGESGSSHLELIVLDRTHPDSSAPLDELAFDANLAIQDGLRYLYLQQVRGGSLDGSWSRYNANYRRSETGFALWAIQNQGHLWRDAFEAEDILADVVRRGLDYLLRGATTSPDISAPNATTTHGARMDGVSDMNGNLRTVDFSGSNREGYENPAICAAILASLDPSRVVEATGPLKGSTFETVVEDAIDWMGSNQRVSGYGRGGWDYDPSNGSSRSDMSINSWYYIAMEGAQEAGSFQIVVPDWLKLESERAVYLHFQKGPGGTSSWDQPTLYGRSFGYASDTVVCGTPAGEFPVRCPGLHGTATTSAGISGLALLETMSPSGVDASFIADQPEPFNSWTALLGPSLQYLGASWDEPGRYDNAYGNRRNYYAMWTAARSLRLTADAIGLGEDEVVLLEKLGQLFDWETGELFELGPNGAPIGTGILAPDDMLEGYFPWLVRHQNTTAGVAGARGSWGSGNQNTPGSHFSREVLSTAWSLLVLSESVFAQPCSSIADNIIEDFSPADGSPVPAGTEVVLSGRVTPDGSGFPISGVFVNGSPADSLDSAGNFFELVHVSPGQNEFHVLVVQPCGDVETTLSLYGAVGGQVELDQYELVGSEIEPDYANTTWIPGEQILQVDVTACNIGQNALLGPLLMVFDTFTNSGVSLENPDGYTPEGDPYVLFGSQLDDPDFAPGDCSLPRMLRFHSAIGESVDFELQWLAPANQPPVFTTIPAVEGQVGETYSYDANAIDPNGHEVVYSSIYGPQGMTVDPQTGLVTWPTEGAGPGGYAVGIRAEDGFGGSGFQEFVIVLGGSQTNLPPYFDSVPPTHLPVGVALVYQASAVDPDLDPLTFQLLTGPPGLVASSEGLVSWPTPVPGDHLVRLGVSDGNDGSAEQAWLLSVGSVPTNPHAPVLYGTPPTVAVVGAPYAYQPIAYDLDEEDELVFALPVRPAGMTVDPDSGFVRWIPGAGAVGAHPVVLSVDDQNGGVATQSWTINVVGEPTNRAPVFSSIPPLSTSVGASYTYQAEATDPDEEPFGFSLGTSPAGMTIDASTGLVEWTPDGPGDQVVEVRATDPHGAVGSQGYVLHVAAANGLPYFLSDPELTATVGGLWSYAVDAEDPEGQPLTFALTAAPVGMTIHPQLGYCTWRPAQSDLGDRDVEIRAFDGLGGAASQAFTLVVVPDTQAPTVVLLASPNPAVAGQAVEICVGASDDIGVVGRSLSISGVPAELGPDGCTTLVPTEAGMIELHGEAVDAAGNVGTADLTLEVVEPPSPGTGEVTVHAPRPGESIDRPIPLVISVAGSSSGGPPPQIDWTVRIRAAGSQEGWRQLAQGTGAVEEVEVGYFDPTVLRNGTWMLQALAGVDGGPLTGIELPVDVVGDYKLGNYETTFVDAVLPLSGIPLVLTRTYNSLDETDGDFGRGWQLGLPGDVSDFPAEGSSQGLFVGSRVYVTRADGERIAFLVQFVPDSWIFPFIGRVRFDPEDGVFDSLELPDDPLVFFADGYLYEDLFGVGFNPDLYDFQVNNGLHYRIDEVEGLRTITDIYGNTIDVAPEGLFSSSGPAILFERGAEGRIEQIVLPEDQGPGSSAVLGYAYDAEGRLVASSDEGGAVITYLYEDENHPNYVTAIMDPLGRPLVRNVFDDDGRLVAQCGPDGDVQSLEGCALFELDPLAEHQSIFDALGNRRDLFLDEAGHVVLERQYVEGGAFLDTIQEFDELGNRTRLVDPAGNSWEFEYEGQVLVRMRDPQLHEWVMSYDDEDRMISLQSPDGASREFEYTEEGKLSAVTDQIDSILRYEYGALGGLSAFIDRSQNTWTFHYDGTALPTEIQAPDGGALTLQQDGVGRLTRHVDRSGREVEFLHDPAGRVIEERWDDGNVVETDYNMAGQAVRIEDANARLTFSYWNTGSLKTATTLVKATGFQSEVTYGRYVGADLTPGYDALGRVIAVTDSASGLTEYEYDAAGRPSSIHQLPEATDSTNWLHVDMVHDDAWLLRELRCYTEAMADPALVSLMDYDCGGCPDALSSIEHRNGTSGQVLLSLDLTRTPSGWLESVQDELGLHSYLHDGRGQLLSATHSGAQPPNEWYSYDPEGNRTGSHLSAMYVYGPEGSGNRLLADDEYSYEYDADGSMVRRTAVATGAQLLLEYDHRHRLVRAAGEDGLGATAFEEEYLYDGADRRIAVLRDGVPEYTLYDGQNPIVVVDGSNQVVERRLYGRYLDDLLAVEHGGQALWVLRDQVGTVRGLADEAGTVVGTILYDSFGRRLEETGDAVGMELGFHSRPTSAATGLVDFRARTYDPWQGRFLREDPSLPFGYVFAENSPLVLRDPSGRSVLLGYACLAKNAVTKANSLKPFFVAASLPFYALGVVDWSEFSPELADGVIRATLQGLGENLHKFATEAGPPGGCGSVLQELVGAYGDLLDLSGGPGDAVKLISYIKTLLEIYDL